MMKKHQRILHLGDLHIFKRKRHDEQKHVVYNLIEEAKKENPDIIYVGGDVVDSKTDLSPEQIEIVNYFFNSLVSIAPVICIIGNHDTNLYTKEKLDALDPIISEVSGKYPIYLLRNSGIYNLFDVNWVVYSRIDEINPWTSHKKNEDEAYIGCFHGPVKGCITEGGYKNFLRARTLEDFEGCDFVFLNDIHKRQSFSKGDIVEFATFSGSCLQITADEEQSKGFLIWEYNQEEEVYRSRFVEVENKYGYITVSMKTVNNIPSNTLKKINIVLSDDYDPEEIIRIRNKFSETSINFLTDRKGKNKKELEKKKNIIGDQNYIEKWCKENGVKEEFISKIKNLDELYNEEFEINSFNVNTYDLVSLEVMNFLCFEGKSSINFKNHLGLVGLFGPNHTGKSSILITIMFACFGQTVEESSDFITLVNDQLDKPGEVYVKVVLNIKGCLWEIKRSLVINDKSTKVSINLKVTKLEGKTKTEKQLEDWKKTDRLILRPLLGDEQTFLITVLSSQNQPVEFTSKKNSERLELISRFIGTNNYEKKFNHNNEIVKSKKIQYNLLLQGLSKFPTIKETLDTVNKLKEEISELEKNNNELGKKIEELRKEKQEIILKLEKINIPDVDSTKEEIVENIENTKSLISEFEKKLILLKENYKELIKKWGKEESIEKIEEWVFKIKTTSDKIKLLDKEIEEKRKQKSNIGLLFVDNTEEENIEIKKEIQKQIEDKKEKYKTLVEEFEKEKIKWKDSTPYEDYSQQLTDCDLEISLLDEEINKKRQSKENDLCPTCNRKWAESEKEELDDEIGELERKKVSIKNENEKKNNIIKEKKILCKTLKDECKFLETLKKELVILEKTLQEIEKESENIEFNKKNNKIRESLEEEIKGVLIEKEKEQSKIDLENKKQEVKNSLKQELVSKNSEILKKEEGIERKKKELENLHKKYSVFTKNEIKLSLREKLKKEVKSVEDKIDDVFKREKEVSEDISIKKFEVKNNNKEIEKYNDVKTKSIEVEEKLTLHTLYNQMTHKKGIPLLILDDCIPDINNRMDYLLSNLFDFRVKFEIIDDSLEIVFFYENLPKLQKRNITRGCGEEKTLINLVIRAALSDVSLLPKPTFLMLDEIFSMLDKENIDKMKILLDRFGEFYKTIIMITHNNSIKDWADSFLILDNKNGKTKIVDSNEDIY